MRLTGWESELAKFLREALERPFVWGENDCCLFAADAVKLLHGIDYMAAFRGQYDSEITAGEALESLGEGALLQTMQAIMAAADIAEIDLAYAQRGDVAYVMLADQPSLCVVDMSARSLVGMSFNGIVTLPINQASVVWGIR